MELPNYSNGYTLCLNELLHYRSQCRAWLPPARSLWSTLSGQHHSKQLGRGMDFSEVRRYQAGDDIRAIDWRVTARTGKPHTKLFSEEREKPVIIYVDFSRSMQFGSTLLLKSVQAAHLAALTAWIAVLQNDRVGAVIDLGNELIELKPQSRQRGVLLMLQKLVECQQKNIAKQALTPADNDHLSTALRAIARLSPKGSDIVMISDFVTYRPHHDSLFTQVHKHNTLRLMQIYDSLEQGETQFRGVELIGDFKSSRWMNFSAIQSRKLIKKAFESQQDSLKLLCTKMQFPYHQIASDTPLLAQLSGTF